MISKSFKINEKILDEDMSLAELESEQGLSDEIIAKRKKGLLRTGYTTGTSAAAATKAAIIAITEPKVNTLQVELTLPKGKVVKLDIAWTIIHENTNSVTCAVIKDGGDDPDVTNGAEICSTISINNKRGYISIEGGKGVGRVTRPGLGLDIGSAAINPIPRMMIEKVIKEVGFKILQDKGITATISVPNGEVIAKKTDNPRLGIIGGISILGTSGIVYPYSTASFAASIKQSLDIAMTLGSDMVILTTGGRSEEYAKQIFNNNPDYSFIQMGDFSGYTIKQCMNRKLRKVIIAGFIGKLTKMAMGVKQTHVRGSHVSMEFMANLASQCTTSNTIIKGIKEANTARHVSEIIIKNNIREFFDLICKYTYIQMNNYAENKLDIVVLMFDFNGAICGIYPSFPLKNIK